ncbi:dihydropyrimidinase [Burkholderia sp. Ac-20344]|uniref:dihydropyrimidinase n=1 Tax=Burkholderia sp. Ac-20344 TaxID=2703890 RepID=UPI00197C9CC7|nr:dihydropyrimidinase [Burkholderia sp. Ac-20344]MBN3830348.1 dihydropyrimidinase [Burkholderia sp. Ac-20344]
MTHATTRTLIKGGRLVTAIDDYVADFIVEGERIVCIGHALEVGPDTRVIDATGLLVFPGGVDCHTHMENTFGASTTCDNFASGTRSAAFGGTTTIVDFALQTPDTSPLDAIARAGAKASSVANIDYGFHVIVTQVDEQVLADMRHAIRHEGVSSFKMFMAYPGTVMSDDAAIFRAMRMVGQHGGMIALHAENGTVIDLLIREALEQGHTSPRYHALTRPAIMEGEATHRGIKLAELAEAPVYFVHLSAKEALKHVIEARDLGIPVFAETCPHYLFFDESVYADDSFDLARYVMSPPLRSKEAQQALWTALKTDDLQLISTDHCPYCMKEGHRGNINQKPLGSNDFSKIPNGVPGVETRMTVVYDGGVRNGRISLNRFVELMSTAPAKLFGLFPRKGTLAVGSDADIVLFDPNETHTIRAETQHSDCDFTLFEGRQVTGRVKKVMLRGQWLIDDGTWVGSTGRGQFIARGELNTHGQAGHARL